MPSVLRLLLFAAVLIHDQPLSPARSPDGQILATTEVPQTFVTPEGGNYKLLLNSVLAYPPKPKRSLFSAYQNWHTFLSPLAWSPDSRYVAFAEKIYNWEYLDPYGRNFDGIASKKRVVLAIVSRDGRAKGYRLGGEWENMQLSWIGPGQIAFDGKTYDLATHPPEPID